MYLYLPIYDTKHFDVIKKNLTSVFWRGYVKTHIFKRLGQERYNLHKLFAPRYIKERTEKGV